MYYTIDEGNFTWASHLDTLEEVRELVFSDLHARYRKKHSSLNRDKTLVVYRHKNDYGHFADRKKAGELRYIAKIGNLFWYPANSKKKYIVNRHGKIAEF